ncbi:hypothetical protein [Sphingomonas sp. AX6]|uniref:hypothetical protein n=1 Tax=Sphingomonas sp. AX6 TaxID=2653171 RepID=UPI0012F24FD9|nr:hypothetical protein [Sphingomonas sp. AX6]VXC51197.1 conserved hypothetical protein [Sphingomonas sp. AX6]
MEPLVYVMAILGCGDPGTQCQEARLEPVTYVSAAQCRTEIPNVLMRSTDLDYPTIGAACQSNRERAAQNKPMPDANRG